MMSFKIRGDLSEPDPFYYFGHKEYPNWEAVLTHLREVIKPISE
jgi:hypothetical protein